MRISIRRLVNWTSVGLLLAAVALGAPLTASADVVHPDDVIIQGSAAIGFDAVNGEVFSFDTLRLKENNLRINFTDTSTTASFPKRDWTILVNDSTNGGLERFSIQDVDAGRIPFTIEGNAPSNALYVDDGGRIGVKTGTPVVDLHIVNGNTPTVRLEQNGSSGFTPQTWDLAGNEANFFIRDVTNGSKLPFRIQPNAPSNSIYIKNDGNVGFGTSSPTAKLQVNGGGGTVGLKVSGTDSDTGINNEIRLEVENTSATIAQRHLMRLINKGGVTINMEDTNLGETWQYQTTVTGNFRVNKAGSGVVEADFIGDGTGNLVIGGMLTQNSSRDAKENFVKVDPQEILERVGKLDIAEWNYKHAPDSERRVGPFAEQFHAAFGLGTDDKHIAPSDVAGVALVAIQGLKQQIEQKDRQIAELSERVEKLAKSLEKVDE